jgi:hypothetical protein
MRLLDNVEHWRTRAKEMRESAEAIEDRASREAMLGMATEYDRLAELAEQRFKDKEQQKQD